MYRAYINLLSLILTITALVTSFSADAIENIIADKHYKILPRKISAEPDVVQFRAKDEDKVQVLFFFNYGCHVCNALNRPFDMWAKSKSVPSYHIPVTSRGLESLTKAYYTAMELDPSGKIDDAIFDGIHKERINYSRESLLEELFEEYDISKDKFRDTYDSFYVARKVQESMNLVKAYNITATPIIIINGKKNIYLTSLVLTHSIETLFKTLDFILKKEK